MMYDGLNWDLEEALYFQKKYTKAVINANEAQFEDNGILSVFKLLNSYNMPSKWKDLFNWDAIKLMVLCLYYRK